MALAEPAYGVIPASPEIAAWVTAGHEKFAGAPKINWNPAAVPPAADHIQPFPITYTTSAALWNLRAHPGGSVRRASGLVLVGNAYLGITSRLPATREELREVHMPDCIHGSAILVPQS
jgi:hypothetical protein